MNAIEEIQQAISNENIVNAMRTAARDILPVVADRIFTNGLDSDNSIIGEYSTNPINVAAKDAPSGGGGYFPGGYREFKQSIGRGSKVNLKLFGRLQSDYLTSKEVVSGLNMKFELKDSFNADKKEWMEDHFNKDIFSLTTQETETVKETFAFELFRRI